MTPLAGAVPGHRRESLGWGLAIGGALLAHLLVAAVLLWESNLQASDMPPAAPMVVDLAFLAAPEQEQADLPPGPQQTEAAPAPEQVLPEEKIPEEPVEEPVPELQSEVALDSPPEPVEQLEQETRDQPPEPPSEAAPSDQSAPETTAPVAMDAAETSEVASAPSVGMPSPQVVNARLRWEGRLMAHLDRRKRYPRQARVRHQEGVPYISFSMDRSGKVLSHVLMTSSGTVLLDEEALALIVRAQPLPPPPPEIPGDVVHLTVPVEFFIGR